LAVMVLMVMVPLREWETAGTAGRGEYGISVAVPTPG
jgi:hypothetical protein